MTMPIKRLVVTLRRSFIRYELANNEYQLARIFEMRREDFQDIKDLNERQIDLKSELRRLEVQ
jgi:hypothetical protein